MDSCWSGSHHADKTLYLDHRAGVPISIRPGVLGGLQGLSPLVAAQLVVRPHDAFESHPPSVFEVESPGFHVQQLIEQLGQTMPVDKITPSDADADKEKPFFDKVKDLFG